MDQVAGVLAAGYSKMKTGHKGCVGSLGSSTMEKPWHGIVVLCPRGNTRHDLGIYDWRTVEASSDVRDIHVGQRLSQPTALVSGRNERGVNIRSGWRVHSACRLSPHTVQCITGKRLAWAAVYSRWTDAIGCCLDRSADAQLEQAGEMRGSRKLRSQFKLLLCALSVLVRHVVPSVEHRPPAEPLSVCQSL